MAERMAMIRVNTSSYVWAHGRDPRGYGGWIFTLPCGKQFMATGLYGAARREAMKAARVAGQDGYLTVEP